MREKDIQFTKMSGSGNDFIIIDNRDGRISPEAQALVAKTLCQRRFSVGADGLILVEHPSGSAEGDEVDFCWQFYNADGSVAEMCGNGARCVARFAHDHGIAQDRLSFSTLAGPIHAQVKEQTIKVALTRPENLVLNQEIQLSTGPCIVHTVNTGVPHVVVMVADMAALEALDVEGIGREIRYHEAFALGGGTNVNFVTASPALAEKSGYTIRTYERGVEGETFACGTGATATAVIAVAKDGIAAPVSIHTWGGELLTIDVHVSTNKQVYETFLEGAVHTVYTGILSAATMQQAGVLV